MTSQIENAASTTTSQLLEGNVKGDLLCESAHTSFPELSTELSPYSTPTSNLKRDAKNKTSVSRKAELPDILQNILMTKSVDVSKNKN